MCKLVHNLRPYAITITDLKLCIALGMYYLVVWFNKALHIIEIIIEIIEKWFLRHSWVSYFTYHLITTPV